jgi:predicted nucleic acid-binding protein
MRLRAELFATTSPVLSEACFLLPAPNDRQRLRYLIQTLEIAVVETPSPWWTDVFDWLERYQEQEPDLADAQIAVLCSKQPTCRVWTYDDEFRTIWRRADGSRMPLATRLPVSKITR